jgi:hypothetical protein
LVAESHLSPDIAIHICHHVLHTLCCPCQVVYGLDYLLPESAARLNALRGEVVGHLGGAPDSLLVVEEYDKMDCAARGLWRQLLQHPERANITNNRWGQAHHVCALSMAMAIVGQHVLQE